MKSRSNYPARPKPPGKNAGAKSWDSYREKLRKWKSLCNSIRSILGTAKKKTGGKKRR